MITIGVEYDVTPPAEWLAALRHVSPKADRHSWLYLRWFADNRVDAKGVDVLEPRWVLYEMVPRAFVDDWSLVEELDGPHPDTIPVVWKRRVRDGEKVYFKDSNISVFQWEMWRRYHCHARPSLVIQGSKGGHLVAYGPEEVWAARAVGAPERPPQVGELPYAPFDARTVRLIQEHSKLLRSKNDLAEFHRQNTGAGLKRARVEAEQQFRERYATWLFAQIEEPAEHFVRAYKAGDLPMQFTADSSAPNWERAHEQQLQRFIERGAA